MKTLTAPTDPTRIGPVAEIGSSERHRDLLGILFPSGVRLWHFIVLPAAGMAAAIFAFHELGLIVLPRLHGAGLIVYAWARYLAIGVMMSSLIAWLAFRHRREYESKLTARQLDLENARDFLSSIIEGSGEAIVTRDAEGRVTSWNRAAEQIYGWRADEMLGRTIECLLPADPKYAEEVADNDRRVRQGRTIPDFETVRIRKDGSRILVRVTRSPIYGSDGSFVGTTGIVRDVTRLKEMERRLLEQETLAALGEMAAQVAHEIKNPLTGIRGACEIMSDGFDRRHPHREIAEEVVRQMDRLNRSVEDLLQFSRPKALDARPTDLHQVLDRVIHTVLEDPRSRGVRIEREFDPRLSPLRVDPRQMEQVFLNVVLNGLQAMEFRGELQVATEACNGEARVHVRDGGPGIPEDVSDRIFKPFFTTRAKGTGLGLAIVKNIVEAHGGAVRARNRSEGGAEITVVLPTED